MPSLTTEQEQAFRDHLRTTNARETCPLCDAGRWSLRVVCGGEFLGRVCSACGHVLLFDWKDIPRSKTEIEIGGMTTLNGKQIGTLVYPAIKQLIDDDLAISLVQAGIPGAGKSGVGGSGYTPAAQGDDSSTPIRPGIWHYRDSEWAFRPLPASAVGAGTIQTDEYNADHWLVSAPDGRRFETFDAGLTWTEIPPPAHQGE